MAHHRTWRSRALRLGVAAGTATAAVVAGVPHVAFAAALTGTVTITSPTGGKLAAETAKQVILLTITGQTMSEALVTGVNLGGDAACQNIPTYIVTSPTTIAVKTPTGGCPATTAAAGDNIDIVFAGGNTLSKTGGLFFVAAPALADLADKPVINENSALLDATNQSARFVTNGGQVVRVKAAATYAFDPRSSAGLAVSMGGKAGTDVKVYDGTTGAQIPANTQSAPAAGNYLTFKTATGMSGTDSSITVTQNGVSKTFAAADTGAAVVAAPTVTSLSTTVGRVKGSTATNITGTGFSKTPADYAAGGTWKVNFCGKSGTVTAVNAAGTQISVTTPDVSNDADGLGVGKFAGPCPVTVVDTTNNVTSPISAGSYFTFVNE